MTIASQGTRFANQSLSFWRQEDVSRLDSAIPILLPANTDPRGRFPSRTPSMDSIIEELHLAEISYVSLKTTESTTFINLLVGRLVVSGTIKPNDDGHLRIRLNKRDGIKFADNYFRARIMSTGIRIEHRGILLKTGNELRSLEIIDQSIANGNYARALLALSANTAARDAAALTKAASSAEEIALLDTVQQYIDVEYELEQAKARQTPPFTYLAIRPEPRAQTYRLFFRMTLEESDYNRLLDLKPGLLGIGEPGNSELSAEVVNPEPTQGKPEIIISVDKQVGRDAIPATGQLFLDALPTLKNVRSNVVEQVRDGLSPNGWFVRVAAGTYYYPELTPVMVDIPPSEYPPNPSQLNAIFKGAGTDDFVLVLGPPGTGKTTVILQWVQHFVKQGMRVLVTSQNNKAVDNVLERLAREEGTECVRLGNENKVSDSVSHLLIDRFATTIQKKLVERLVGFRNRLTTYIVYLDALQRSMLLLSSPAAVMLQKKKQESSEQLAKSDRQMRLANLDYLEADSAAGQSEQLLGQIQSRLTEMRLKSVLNPLRWIGVPLLLLRTRAAGKIAVTRRNASLQARQSYDKLSAEVVTLGNRTAAIESRLQEIIDKITKQMPAIPEAPLNELPVPTLSPDIIGNTSEMTAAITPLAERAQQAQTIVESWEKIITTERQRSIYSILLGMVDVVGATCIGINTNIDFKNIPFDVVIVDESGQIQIQNLVVPLSRAPRAILVGDHKQLPPVVNEDIVKELEARDERSDLMKSSWFEWLWNEAPEDRKVMLDTQFRCPAVISDFISQAFYDNQYHAGKGMDKKAPLFSFTSSPILFIDTSRMAAGRRYEQSRHNGERKEVMGNQLETDIVIAVLERAIQENPGLASAGEIGVIVPYANHVTQMQQSIKKRRRKNSTLNQLVTPLRDLVASVDSYQGQERDLIVLALSRSNAKGAVGFLADWRRLNVAMTRAKRQLVMVGDLSTLTKPPRAQDSPDVAFKQAMSTLAGFVRARCQLDQAADWVNDTRSTVKAKSAGQYS